MTTERCTLVEPVIRGFVWVKFEDEKERHKLWLKSYERCARDATEPVDLGCGCVAHRCEAHRHNGEEPSCV